MAVEASGTSKTETRQTPSIDDLVSFVDSEFKGSYLRSRIKYYLSDILLIVAMLFVVIIIMYVLVLAAPLLASEQAGLAALLAYFALVLSLLQFIFRWTDMPSVGNEAYSEDVIKRNCNEVSKKHKVDKNLLLYALVSMKSVRPGAKLAEVKRSSPELFTESALVSRLYGPAPR